MPFHKLKKQIIEQLGLSEQQIKPDQDNLELAVACLLIEMCQADSQTDDVELNIVARELQQHYKLDSNIVDELIHQALLRNNKDTSFHPYVNIVNEQATVEEKTKILLQMWQVAYADNKLDKYEEHYMRRLSELLRLPHRVLIQTKHKVQADLNAEP